MKKLLIALVVLMSTFPVIVNAEGPVFEVGYNCKFSWVLPTTYTNGDALDSANIHKSQIYVSKYPDFTDATVTVVTGTSVSCDQVGGVGIGQNYAAITTFSNLGLESNRGASAAFVFKVPKPPTLKPSAVTIFRVQ